MSRGYLKNIFWPYPSKMDRSYVGLTSQLLNNTGNGFKPFLMYSCGLKCSSASDHVLDPERVEGNQNLAFEISSRKCLKITHRRKVRLKTLLILWIPLFLLLVLSMLAASAAFATQSADSIVLRTSVSPEEPWIGQRVLLRLDVLGENGWAKLSKIGNIDVPGAYVFRTESQGIRIQERISGVSYTGQRYELSIYPQQGGIIEIPSFPVEITIKAWGANAKETVQRAETTATAFRCRVPPGADIKRGIISTDRLIATQTWEPDIGEVSVGGTIQRTIQMSAVDVPAMAFTPLYFNKPEKVDLYTQTPITGDKYSRGTLTGRRTETITYLFKEACIVELPAVEIIWWDLENKQLRKTQLASRSIEVVLSDIVDRDVAQTTPNNKADWLLLGTLLLVTGFIIWLSRIMFYHRWLNWRKVRSESEKAHFKSFVRAARTENPANALNALMRWLDRIHANTQTPQLNRFLELYADPLVASEVDQMIRAIDPTSQIKWNKGRIVEGVSRARRKWIKAQHRIKESDDLLPLLNP